MADETNITETEEWRDVPGWPAYQASSLGRVRGPRRMLSCKAGPLGYAYTSLSDRANGRRLKVFVHKIICAAFLGERPEGLQINHINNNRADNRIANLEYVTAKQNCQHRKVHGTFPTGENNGRARLTAEQVAEIRKRRASGEKLLPLSIEYGVHKNTIWWITSGKTWAD